MAKFYGKESKYLFWNEKLSYLVSLYFLLILTYIAYFVFVKHYFYLTIFPAVIALAIVCGPFAFCSYFLYKYFDIRGDKFFNGRRGEWEVYIELLKLTDDFIIIQDVKKQNGGNIDFVVLGPTGIFAIEVKSHSGIIEFNGELLRNGKPFKEKNILKQAKSGALALRENLNNEVSFIYPVIVFSNNYAKVNFGFHQQENVTVVQKQYLNNLINSFPATFSLEMCLKLKAFLIPS